MPFRDAFTHQGGNMHYTAYVLYRLQPVQRADSANKEEADRWLVAKAEEYLAMGESLEEYDFVSVANLVQLPFMKLLTAVSR